MSASNAQFELTTQEAWSLAAAMSPRPTVRMAAVDVDGSVLNEYPQSQITPLTEEAPERPWAVYLTDLQRNYWLLCFDLDGKTPETAAAAVQDTTEIASLLVDAGLDPVVCASNPRGGRHIWVALAEPVTHELVTRMTALMRPLYKTLDLSPINNAEVGCVRSPGAPHRHGGRSTILSGSLNALTHPTGTVAGVTKLIERLSTLVTQLADETPDQTAGSIATDDHRHPFIPGPKRRLPATATEALNTDATQADASAVLWRVLTGAASAHWQYADVARLVPSAPGLEHVRTVAAGARRTRRIPEKSTEILRRQWDRAVAYISSGRRPAGSDPTFDARAELVAQQVTAVQARADAAVGRWTRGGGPADRRILDALCVLSLSAVKCDVEADIRRLALTVGVGRETARTALLRLAADGWIERTKHALEGRASHWTISPGAVIHTFPGRDRSQAALRPPGTGAGLRAALILELRTRTELLSHDLFTSSGLGFYAGNVYSRCTTEVLPLGEISRLTGSDPSQAVQTLTQLTQHDVLTLTRLGWKRNPTELLDAAAQRAGVSGTLTSRANRYQAERATWSWWLSELEWMHTPKQQRRPRATTGQLIFDTDTAAPPARKYPRRDDGRADHRTARAYVDGDIQVPERPRLVAVSEAERLIVEVLGGVAVETLPLPKHAPAHSRGPDYSRPSAFTPAITRESGRVRFTQFPDRTR